MVGWGARLRRWPADQAQKVFATAAIVLAGALTLGLYVPKVIEQPGWDASWRTYVEVSGRLSGLDTDPGVVAVNNPPGFNLASGFPAVVIPDGDPGKLQSVVERYGVSWVILDANHPAGLASLYADPGSVDWLHVRASFPDGQGRQIYLLQVSPASGGG
jgi:hypothetical protein